jgi:hypothetical protein
MTLERIEELALQLAHLTGKPGDHYVRLWLLSSSKDREELLGMLELKLRQLAKPNSLWLEPIPQEHAHGELVLGDVLAHEHPVYPFRMRLDALLRHVTIFGQTGGGKTNLGYLLLQHLLQAKLPFLVCDWKRNYRDLLAITSGSIRVYTVGRSVRPFHINPLIPPPGTSPETWLKKITEIIARAYYVGEGVMSILHRGLDAIYGDFGVYAGTVKEWPTMDDLRIWIEDYIQRVSTREWKSQWIASTQRTLQSLCYGDMSRVLNVDTPTPVQDLLERPVILELDALAEQEKTLIIETLLLWIHHYRLQQPGRERLKHVILIEEAHHVLRKEETHARENVLDVVLREIRELGEGIIMMDQLPAQFSQNAIGNSATSFVFALKDKADVQSAGNFLLLDTDQRNLLHQLPVGMCVVKMSDAWRTPFLVRLPHVRVPKGSVTDDDLRGSTKTVDQHAQTLLLALDELKVATNDVRSSGSSAPIPPTDAGIEVLPGEDKSTPEKAARQLEDGEVRLLRDVVERPFAGVSSRYDRLQVSVRNGNRIKQRLEELGLIKLVPVNKGDSQVKLMNLTTTGEQVVRILFPSIKIQRTLEGAEHRYWKNRVATVLEDAGLHVETEKQTNGHRVDIHAQNGGTTAIEIETGKSDIRKNLRKNLEKGYDQVLILPTNAKARRKAKRVAHQWRQHG